MKGPLVVVLSMITTAAWSDGQIPARLECSALSTNSESKAFQSDVPFAFNNGLISGRRTTSRRSGTEIYSGRVGKDKIIRITGRGAYQNGSQTWRSTFAGSLNEQSETVLNGAVELTKGFGRRACSITFLIPPRSLMAMLMSPSPAPTNEADRPKENVSEHPMASNLKTKQPSLGMTENNVTLSPSRSPPKTEPNPVEISQPDRFSSLLEIPRACADLQRFNSRLNSASYSAICPIVLQCRAQLIERAASIDGYLQKNLAVSLYLGNEAKRLVGDVRASPNTQSFQNSAYNFSTALAKVALPNSGNCTYDHEFIHQNWISLFDGPGYRGPRPFEVWISAGKRMIFDLRARLVEDERTYNSLLTSTDAYEGRDAFTASFTAYKEFVLNENFEAAMQNRKLLDDRFEIAKTRKSFLRKQLSAIDAHGKLLADWSEQLARKLAPVAFPSFVGDVQILTRDLDELAKRTSAKPIDVASDLAAINDRIEMARPKMASMSVTIKRADELSRARASAKDAIEGAKQSIASVQSPRLLPASQQKAVEFARLEIELMAFRPEDSATQQQFQVAIDRARAIADELRTATSQQSEADDLTTKIDGLNSKITNRGANLLDSSTGKTVADLLAQGQLLRAMLFPLNDDQRRVLSNATAAFEKLSLNIDAAFAAGERRLVVRKLGDQYAKENGTRWNLDQKPNPMTDRTDLKASSTQANGEGAVAEIEAKCLQQDVVAFTALIVDSNGKPTISFPQYDSAARFVIGNRRINVDDPQTTAFRGDQFNNRFLILLILGQSARAETSDARRADEVWRALIQIETSQGSIVLRIPMADPTIKKLIDSCM